jgi:hypothetical protein
MSYRSRNKLIAAVLTPEEYALAVRLSENEGMKPTPWVTREIRKVLSAPSVVPEAEKEMT